MCSDVTAAVAATNSCSFVLETNVGKSIIALRMRKVLAEEWCSVFRLAEFWFKLSVIRTAILWVKLGVLFNENGSRHNSDCQFTVWIATWKQSVIVEKKVIKFKTRRGTAERISKTSSNRLPTKELIEIKRESFSLVEMCSLHLFWKFSSNRWLFFMILLFLIKLKQKQTVFYQI